MSDKTPEALIIVPAYSHVDHRLLTQIIKAGIPFSAEHGHSDLPRLRSVLISLAMANAPQRIIFIDSDVVVTAEQIQYLATTTDVHDKQALVGMYPLKDRQQWSVRAADPSNVPFGEDKLFAVTQAGLGIACIATSSLMAVAEKLPKVTEGEVGWWPFCIPVINKDDSGKVQYMGDDLSLWHRLAKCGVSIMCKGDLVASHVMTTQVGYPDLAPKNTTPSPPPDNEESSSNDKPGT